MIDRKLLAALFLGAASPAFVPALAEAPVEKVRAPGSLGIDPAMMDRSVKPGADFNLYANGAWLKTTEIPADRSSVGGFYIADHKTEGQLGELIAEILRSTAPANSDEGRIRDFYRAYLDTAAIDAAGLKPVQPDLDRFAAIRDVKGLSRVLGEQVRADVDPLNATDFQTENLFGLFVTQSLPGTAVMPYVLQGGLGMPEREYYLSSDAKMVELRGKYRAYVAQLLTDAGIADAQGKAQRIYDLELKIAEAHLTREQSEDFQHSAAEWQRGDFAAKAPGIDWNAFFAGAQLGQQQTFAAYHAGAIPKLSALVASQPLQAWKDWLLFHQINTNTDVLPTKLDATRFAFYGTALTGTTEQRPREKRAIAAVNGAIGDALGKLYVEKYFPAAARAEVQAMVENIKTAFAKRVEAIDWMAPATKKEAIEKVRTIEVGVGYPDTWQDYSGLTIGAKTAYANRQAASKLGYRQQLAKIGKPLDRREWWMNAQLVNAVNLPVQNALNFPAAILQRPFFDPSADAAFNYGAIGAVIGHEISHSFDNNGAAFDASGKMRNWWTDADLAKFNEAGKALADQYDGYEPFPGLHVNGKLTLGENIADVAGLAASYDAYRASLGGKEAPVIDGFTGDQRFFIAFGQSWATKMREAALRARIATDGHAPGQYRALTVRNLDAWYKAFDVKPGDALYLSPEKRVRIW
ncbi:M13 family metallopeptidase [Novosphingobium sp. JCM 18896]|uniref:M13 family metallopeptidase n=1 Tax=Novosphingobium sp. JCM 18896 TaxID=2989731 RepID=UPI002223BB32|nr:M13 family metallopeptidase [Novosphingobium sp. JCM 18896]MCW1428296.1 M13 family metallopeptidase [Novosphingobium sp. JCM 18896]